MISNIWIFITIVGIVAILDFLLLLGLAKFDTIDLEEDNKDE